MRDGVATEPTSKTQTGSHYCFPAWLFWIVWGIGPASYGASWVFCIAHPELCNDPPNLLLALMLVLTHLIAGFVTIWLVLLRGPYRNTVEFWMLMLYWAGIAGFISFPGLEVAFPGSIDPAYPAVSMRVSAVVVFLIPAFGIGRFVRARFGRR